MLVAGDQRDEADIEPIRLGFGKRQHLVQRDAEVAAGHGIDVAGQQIGIKRRGVLDQPHGDALEAGLVARPVFVGHQHDLLVGAKLADPVRAKPQARLLRMAVEGGFLTVVERALGRAEDRPLDMLGQDGGGGGRIRHAGIVILRAVQREAGVQRVDRLHLVDQLGGGEQLGHLERESHVGSCHLHAVRPEQIGLERVGDLHAVGAVVALDDPGVAVFQAGHLGAEHADQRAILGVSDHGTVDGQQDAVFDRGVGDVGMHVRRKLHHADGQCVMGFSHRRADQGRACG